MIVCCDEGTTISVDVHHNAYVLLEINDVEPAWVHTIVQLNTSFYLYFSFFCQIIKDATAYY